MKLKLNNLKVNSFETNLEANKANTIRGGYSDICSVFCFTQGVCNVGDQCRFCPTGRYVCGGVTAGPLCGNDTI